MSNKRKNMRKNKAFAGFEQRVKNGKEINLNPLLSIIVNLVPLFLIVLNLRSIVGVEQNHMPPAQYKSASSLKSKKLVDVDINLYGNKTRIVLRDHEGNVLNKKTFKSLRSKKSKDLVIEYISSKKLAYGHLTINPEGKRVNFDELSQAIDISNFKIDGRRLFKNFSIGNIL